MLLIFKFQFLHSTFAADQEGPLSHVRIKISQFLICPNCYQKSKKHQGPRTNRKKVSTSLTPISLSTYSCSLANVNSDVKLMAHNGTWR